MSAPANGQTAIKPGEIGCKTNLAGQKTPRFDIKRINSRASVGCADLP